MLIRQADGEKEITLQEGSRQVRVSCLGPGDVQVSLPEKPQVVLIVNDSTRVLRCDNMTVLILRTQTACEVEIKEFK